MKVEKCNHRVKCDFCGCKNFANYYLSTKGFFKNEFAFCETCMEELFEEMSKIFVPKAIESHFKPDRKVRRRKNEEGSK